MAPRLKLQSLQHIGLLERLELTGSSDWHRDARYVLVRKQVRVATHNNKRLPIWVVVPAALGNVCVGLERAHADCPAEDPKLFKDLVERGRRCPVESSALVVQLSERSAAQPHSLLDLESQLIKLLRLLAFSE